MTGRTSASFRNGRLKLKKKLAKQPTLEPTVGPDCRFITTNPCQQGYQALFICPQTLHGLQRATAGLSSQRTICARVCASSWIDWRWHTLCGPQPRTCDHCRQKRTNALIFWWDACKSEHLKVVLRELLSDVYCPYSAGNERPWQKGWGANLAPAQVSAPRR